MHSCCYNHDLGGCFAWNKKNENGIRLLSNKSNGTKGWEEEESRIDLDDSAFVTLLFGASSSSNTEQCLDESR